MATYNYYRTDKDGKNIYLSDQISNEVLSCLNNKGAEYIDRYKKEVKMIVVSWEENVLGKQEIYFKPILETSYNSYANSTKIVTNDLSYVCKNKSNRRKRLLEIIDSTLNI